MLANVQVVHSLEDADLWSVTLGGRNVVGFYGPDARILAECHRDELAELLGGAHKMPTSNGERLGGR